MVPHAKPLWSMLSGLWDQERYPGISERAYNLQQQGRLGASDPALNPLGVLARILAAQGKPPEGRQQAMEQYPQHPSGALPSPKEPKKERNAMEDWLMYSMLANLNKEKKRFAGSPVRVGQSTPFAPLPSYSSPFPTGTGMFRGYS